MHGQKNIKLCQSSSALPYGRGGAEPKLACWLNYICYNFPRIAPRCRNM